ncbi:CPCC family cysteine-rich protein [Saccharopolyspora antimicrobica]|uniref:CPCC family cysteine-rich protein n=1 Tax=Saccharopolyspora antimicrobica TaxID=455193 RepID=UPI001BA75389
MCGKPENGPYPCPCCGFVTLPERGGYELCSLCFWEDDDHDADEVRGGPNGSLSLTEARHNFRTMGACDERCTQFTSSAPERAPPRMTANIRRHRGVDHRA